MIIRILGTFLTIVYFAFVILAYSYKIEQLFFYLTSPWSSLISIFSYLIIHIASDGVQLMDYFMIFGAVINSIFALFLMWKIKFNFLDIFLDPEYVESDLESK